MDQQIIPKFSTGNFISDSPIFYRQAQLMTTTRRWHATLEFTALPGQSIEFDVRDGMEIGTVSDSAFSIDLSPFAARTAGVSRRHARIEPCIDGLRITDIGSTNGTRVNDRSISPHLPHPLRDGDLVCLGNLEFILRIKPLIN